MSMIDQAEFAQRRRHLLEVIGKNSAALITASPERLRNGDVQYAYRQSSDFYYLTGFPEPEAVALLLSTATGNQFILFSRPYDKVQMMWDGQRIGQLGACADYAADQAYSITELDARLPGYLANSERIFFLMDHDMTRLSQKIHSALAQLHVRSKKAATLPRCLVDLAPYLHEMRLYKSPSELAALTKAAQISAQAHRRVMQICRPGLYEYQLEAELLHEFYYQGSRAPAYNSIVASGANACILHYQANQAQLQEGQLVLVDAGCEYQNYAADITRTFPVNSHFTAEQQALYQVVLEAQSTAIAAIKPGLAWTRLQTILTTVITQGLVDLGLLSGPVEARLAQKAYRRFYSHNSGHWLGLDVHDVGGYHAGQSERQLQANMVFTIEPGIYITAAADIPEKWWNIGIRIEDEIRVTEEGYELLSADVPRNPAAIEDLMRS